MSNPHFWHLNVSNGFVFTTIYDKRNDFDFNIVNFPFLNGDVAHSTSYGIYILQLHCIKSVDFTVKYLASGCQFFYRYFYGRLLREHF